MPDASIIPIGMVDMSIIMTTGLRTNLHAKRVGTIPGSRGPDIGRTAAITRSFPGPGMSPTARMKRLKAVR
jgi:hypothetical protein